MSQYPVFIKIILDVFVIFVMSKDSFISETIDLLMSVKYSAFNFVHIYCLGYFLYFKLSLLAKYVTKVIIYFVGFTKYNFFSIYENKTNLFLVSLY